MTIRSFFLLFPLIFTILVNIHDAYAVSDPITPPPSMTYGDLCKAVVTYSWDVSDIPGASQVRWELKKDTDFNNLEGREPDRLDSDQIDGVQGTVTIDLRDYGQVLNGTEYYFRVVAKNNSENDVARRSDSLIFDLDITPQFTVQLEPEDLSVVNLGLDILQPDIEDCSDSLFYEVKRGNPFTNLTGIEEDRIEQGPININTQNLQLGYPGEQPGTKLYFRIVGKYGSPDVNDDVGKRGGGKSTTIGVPIAEIGISNPAPDAPFIYKLRYYTYNPRKRPEFVLTNDKIFIQVYEKGDATHIKAAECSNFNDSSIEWMAYDGSTTVPKYFSFGEGGEKEICVQLLNKPENQTVGTFSNIKKVSINVVKLVTHEIPFNRETVIFLMDNGYDFTGEPDTDSQKPCGACRVGVDETFPETALIQILGWSKECGCIFEFFKDRATINKPWKVDGFTISDTPEIGLAVIRPPSDNVIRTTAVGVVRVDYIPLANLFVGPPHVSYDNFNITLIGPDGADWRDAFRQ